MPSDSLQCIVNSQFQELRGRDVEIIMSHVVRGQAQSIYLLIANGNSATSVCVQSLEAFSQRTEHHATLDEVVKLHRLLVTAVKHSCT